MLRKIVSGAQTGVDRAALDAALDAGFPCGGWCPRGRRAEDGRLDPRYPVVETRSARYIERTRLNVSDSDGTLVLTRGVPRGGTAATIAAAHGCARPHLVVDLDATDTPQAVASIRSWIEASAIETLNVAGPRASGHPDVYGPAYDIVAALIAGTRPG